VNHYQGDERGNRQGQPPRRQRKISKDEEAQDRGGDADQQPYIADPPELLMLLFNDRSARVGPVGILL
jgi:hypothetical protein